MYTKGQILHLVVCPRTRPRTFLNCFVEDTIKIGYQLLSAITSDNFKLVKETYLKLA